MSNNAGNTPSSSEENESGARGAAKFVTSTVGNAAGGISRTAGAITGAGTRGIGDTFNSVVGKTGKPVGDALKNVGTGVENGVKSLAQGMEDAGQWRR